MLARRKHRGQGGLAAQGGGRPRRKTTRRPGLFGRSWRLVRRVFTLGIGGALGALIAYYLDPDQGEARRARQADQLQAAMRQQRSAVQHQASDLTGKVKDASHTGPMTAVGDSDVTRDPPPDKVEAIRHS